MTAIPQSNSSRAVSDRILKPLREVAARQRKVTAGRGALQTLAAGLALLLPASLLLGSFAATPAALRVGVAALAWAAVAAAAVYFLRPALRRRTIADAAFAAERHAPAINERLSSTVELSAEHDAFAGSPALLRHLARQAEADAAAVRPERVVPTDTLRRWAAVIAPLLLLWAGLALFFPRPVAGGVYRLLMPWKTHLPAVLARVAVAPGDVTIAEGDALEIKATVNDDSGHGEMPSHVVLLTQPASTPAGASGATPLARDLRSVSPRVFEATLDDLRQSFRYQVTTPRGESPWFTATVLPRPTVTALDVRYEYPRYSGIDARSVSNADGNLRALQGTDVTLTLHTSGALDTDPGKSRLTITEGGRQRTVDLKAVDGRSDLYEAKLTVFNSGTYRIQLVNAHGLSNRDEQPRTISAELDQPPRIVITAPQPQVTVRPDDDVPVLFTASDDFGLAKVRAVVQVDDKSPSEIDVPPARGSLAGGRTVDGTFVLSVTDHLAAAGVDEAATVTYWLTATDNRDPDPQTVESARQTLKIDKNQPLPYRDRVEQEQARDLTRAIDKAIQRLGQAEGPVNSLKSIDNNRAMNADEKRRSDEQRDQLSDTAKELAEAAESNLRNAFRDVARKARQVAEGPVQGAAENVALARLNADQSEPRKKAAGQAADQVVEARKALEELKKVVESHARDVRARRELDKLAEKQRQLAEAQAKLPAPPKSEPQSEQVRQARERLQQRQRELLDRLNRAIGENESLRDPKAAEQAVRLRELLDRLQQIQKDQAPLQDQVARRQQAADLREKAEEIGRRQQKLNEEIASFSEKQHAPLQRADARAPDRQHQAAIVDRLRNAEVEAARDLQNQSSDQLKQAAQRLEERGRANDLKPDPVQQTALNLQEQARQSAQQAADRAKDAGEKLRQAKAGNDATQIAEAQARVDEAAQSLAKQAESAAASAEKAAQSDDATARKNGEEAVKAAREAATAVDGARQAAKQGNADAAAEKLAEAGKRVVAAREKGAEAVKADIVDDQRDASTAAAAHAKSLAERQRALADASKQNAAALADARRDLPSPQDLANRQNQLKDQTQQAKQQAEQLGHLAEPTNPSLADRVKTAQKLLDEAATAEARAAEGERSDAQADQQSEEALQQAGQADQQAAQHDQEAARAVEQAEAHDQQADAAGQSSAAAEARADAAAAQGAKEQAGREKQQASEDRRRAEGIKKESADSRRRAAEATTRADAARQRAASARREVAEKQSAAQEALAKAEDALRDIDREAVASAKARAARRTGANELGQPPQDAAVRGDPAKAPPADGSAGANGAAPPPPLTPEQAMRQAAQGAQEASQAQQQAINNGNDAANALDASRQAAAALEQAAAAAAAAAAPAASTDSVATAPEEQTPSQGLGKGSKPSASAGQSPDSRHGIGVSAGGSDDRPASVQQLGISAGDWARLGPLTQQELLNAAQQTGPPAYREMIKNYYVRIARLDRDAGAAAGKPNGGAGAKKK